MNVLVFGGTGWLGHRIALKFEKAGYTVKIASRGKKNKFSAAVAHLKHYMVDKNDKTALNAVLDDAACSIIIDSVPEVDVIKSLAERQDIQHYIHCSSTGGYTPLTRIPGNETLPYKGYPHGGGWTQKAQVDDLVMELFRSQKFPGTVLRPCCILGSGMMPIENLGGRDPEFIKQLLNEETIDLADGGLALIQPIWLDDLAQSFVAAAKHPQAAAGEIFNVTADYSVTFRRYCEIGAETLRRKLYFSSLTLDEMLEKYAGKCNEVGMRFLAEHMCFDNSKIKALLQWQPEFSPEAAIAGTFKAALEELK